MLAVRWVGKLVESMVDQRAVEMAVSSVERLVEMMAVWWVWPRVEMKAWSVVEALVDRTVEWMAAKMAVRMAWKKAEPMVVLKVEWKAEL
jgi:hypothetical protein